MGYKFFEVMFLPGGIDIDSFFINFYGLHIENWELRIVIESQDLLPDVLCHGDIFLLYIRLELNVKFFTFD